MKTLITGSNGFLGTWLTQRLAQRGDEVRCLVRKASGTWGLQGQHVSLVQGDVTDPATLVPALAGVDTVFHLAGIRRSPSPAEFDLVNAEGTRNVCEAMLAAGAKRLVLCGSLSAMGPSQPDRPHVESDPFAPAEWYGESKAKAEQIAFSYNGKLEVTVARPPRILGPADRENLVFFKLVMRGWRLAIGGGPRPLSMVDVDDVVDGMLLLAERPEAVGEAFFLTANETTTIEELQDRVARDLGLKPRTIYLPERVLSGLGSAADVISRATGRHLPLNRKLARQLLAPAWTCSGEKAERLLGFRPARSLASSIDRSAVWYRQQGWI